MERLVILHPQRRIEVRHLALDSGRKGSVAKTWDSFGSLHEVKEAAERDYILSKLDETGGQCDARVGVAWAGAQ